MAGRKKIKKEKLLDNPQRLQILNFIAAPPPKSITQIETGLKINRGNVRHHIKLLSDAGYLEKHEQEDVAGKPVIISVSPKSYELLRLKLKADEEYNKNLKKVLGELEPELKKEADEAYIEIKKQMQDSKK